MTAEEVPLSPFVFLLSLHPLWLLGLLMDTPPFRRWVGSSWSRASAGLLAPLAAFLTLGCGPAPAAIQRPPSHETPTQRVEAQERAYQAKFEQQPPDAAAKKRAEDGLGRVTQNLAGSGVGKLECRGTMCRLETQHQNDAALQKFIYSAFLDVRTAWRGSFAVVRVDRAKQGDGPVSAVVFLGEERQDWPKFPETPAKVPAQGESTPPTKPEKR